MRRITQPAMQNPEQSAAATDFPTYPAYKPSDVQWLGDIPAHWDVRWLKFWVDTNKRTLSEKTDPNFQFRYIEIGGVSAGELLNEPAAIRFGSAPSRARRIVRQGDTIVSTVRAYLKAVWFADDEADDLVCSTGFAVLTPKSDAFPKFVSYVVQSAPFTHQVMANSVGVAYPAISERKLRVLSVPVPPLPEQRAIAAYLDRKGAIARRYAHVARHIIDTLRELRQVEIHDAVTRGLNEDIPLKPSGVEWLRDVPEHWDVCQVKRKYAIKLGKMLQNYPKRETDIAVPYLKVPNVQWAGVSAADAQTMWASPRDVEQYSIRKGDLLVCEGGEGGRCAILEEEPPPNCIIQNALHRVRPLRDDSNAYLKYTMNAIDTMGWFDAINNKATIAHFTVEKFSTLFIPNPPIAEQRAIAEYLDAKTAAIDAAIAHYERMAELVAEYWTVLVADAVTGRIDLRQTAAE